MTSVEDLIVNRDAVKSGKWDDVFEWQQDYENILEQIAKTDDVDAPWVLLQKIIRYKINLNVQNYLSNESEEGEPVNPSSELASQSSVFSLPSPPTLSPAPALQGMVIPPFPKRGQTKNPILRLFNSTIDAKEAESIKQYSDKYSLPKVLFVFFSNSAPPFTIQRLCELCLWPRKYHKTVGKYLRALERVVRVTSTKTMYSSEEVEEGQPASTYYPDTRTLRIATTPVFSPIPFLHLDARRSRSPSPFELSATRQTDKPIATPKEPGIGPPKGLGLVDELDDPKPGHLADHPTPLTAVTKILPLSKRFVKGPEEDTLMQNSNGKESPRPSEDAEVEGMVLDPEEQK